MQKFLFDVNRDPGLQQRFLADRAAVLNGYPLSAEERGALMAGDVGLVYVLGANGQLLMHFAALLGMENCAETSQRAIRSWLEDNHKTCLLYTSNPLP